MDEASQQVLLSSDGPGVAYGGARQLESVVGRVICQRATLEVTPDVLDGVQLRGVGRQQHGAELRAVIEERLHRTGTMGRESVPDQDQRTTDMTAQRAEEADQHRRGDVRVGIQGDVEPESATLRRDRHDAGGRDLLARAGTLPQDGRLAPRCPGAAHQRRHQQAAFVEEGDGRFQPRGVFFTRGQVSRTQPRIATSSRSRAWRSGFWGENPSERRSRPTCEA